MQHPRVALAFALLCWGAGGLPAAEDPSTKLGASWPKSGLRQEIWRTEQGLPQNTVPAIVQSADGYLWAGTELGLVRFDGLHFTVFDKANTPALKSNVIDALLEDSRGNLWIGTVGGGLTRLSGGRFTTYTTRDGLSNNSISCLLEDRSGDIWIGTNGGGVDRLHKDRFSSFTTQQGLADNQVFALAQTQEDGALWIGTHDGLTRFRDGGFRNYQAADGLPGNDIRALLALSANTLWIGTSNGLSRFQNDRFRNFGVRDGLTSNFVAALSHGPDGDLWIGTLAGGITRLSGDHLIAYPNNKDLPIKDVWCIYRDREQNFWIGTGGGGLVHISSQNTFVAYGRASGLSNDVTLPVYEDHAGSIWVGTNGGGLNRLRDGKFTSLTTKNGIADNLVFSVGEGLDGALWVGTQKGLNRLQAGKIETFTTKDGLPNDIVIVVYPDSQGAVWVGTRAGLSRFKDHRFTTFTTKDGLSNNVVQALHEDRQHRLWIGTAGGGLDLFANGRFERFDSHHGLSNDVVLSIHEDTQGTLWIGTDGGGLVRLKDGHFFAFTTKEGLLDDAIFRILEDDAGNLWMSSNKGVFRVSLQGLDDFAMGKIPRLPMVSYGTSDGMSTVECNGGFQPAGWKSHDGRLWFPTMRGVVVVDPREALTVSKQQRAIVEEVIANGKGAAAGASLLVPPGAGELEFHFSAPNLHSADRIRFEYRLEGFDSGWVNAGSRRAAYYTNIPPGNYRFRVVATNEDGTWSSSEASLPLTLEPHFYQTFLFYLLSGFAVAGAAIAIHFAHVKNLRERERTLEQHVQQRTVELRNEIAERVRAELDSIKAKEAAEKATRVKSEFLANMSHEIRTPMNAILGMTQLTLNSHLNEQQREHLEVVQDSATSLLRVIDDILDFSKVEAGKLELDPIDFALRETLEASLKPLALRARQKGLRLDFSMDPDLPFAVHADPLRLRQVVLNLVGNAIKFTNEGSVTLHASCEGFAQSEILLHFIITDTGVGIPEDKLGSIFEVFSQADSSTTRKFGGTGLGLAICTQLVKLMGGSMWAKSQVGQGSEFHFTVNAKVARTGPIAESNGPEFPRIDQPALSAVSPPKPKIHILLAEDNPANRMVARLTLEKFGINVHEVSNGVEALAAARRFQFDVILMDCRMPVMDGYEATRKIRALPNPAGNVPIVALTASAFKEDRVRAEQAGMDDFIAKPFQDADLIEKCFTWAKLGVPAPSREETMSVGSESGLMDRFKNYSPEFLREVMQLFVETTPQVFEKLLLSLDEQDWETAKASAHWLRGGAARLIAPEFQEQLGHMESACSAERPVIAHSDVTCLQDAFRRAYRLAESWLAQDKSHSAPLARAQSAGV